MRKARNLEHGLAVRRKVFGIIFFNQKKIKRTLKLKKKKLPKKNIKLLKVDLERKNLPIFPLGQKGNVPKKEKAVRISQKD